MKMEKDMTFTLHTVTLHCYFEPNIGFFVWFLCNQWDDS